MLEVPEVQLSGLKLDNVSFELTRRIHRIEQKKEKRYMWIKETTASNNTKTQALTDDADEKEEDEEEEELLCRSTVRSKGLK